MRLPTFLASLFAISVALPTLVKAHEFWISPVTYMNDSGNQLVADLRVGENFKGNASSFVPQRFARFDLAMNGKVMPVEGRLGDRPALAVTAPGDGLVVVVHQTNDLTLTYREAEKFANFARHKDFAWAIQEHVTRGLPETGFQEVYSRYAKSLMSVGDGAGADSEVGLLTEIVALANPYTDDLSGGMPVKVLFDGEVRADTQVELFEKAPDGSVTVTLHRTDAQGQAVIPVQPGHEYLVDSVLLRAVDPGKRNGAVWESLWASLTFMVPAQ